MYTADTGLEHGGMNIKVCEKEFSGLGLRLLISAILLNGIQIGGQIIAVLVNKEWLNNMDILLAWSMIPQYVIAYPLAFLIVGKYGDKRKIEKHKMKTPQFFIAFLMTYALMMLGNLIGISVTTGISFLKGESVDNSIAELLNSGNIWIMAIYIVILAPICEELLFRKMVCDRVAKYGQGITIMVSGLTFGLAHGNFNQFFYAFFIGCFFAFIYVKTGRVGYTIGLHMIVNFIGSVIGGLLLQNVDLVHLSNSGLIIYALYILFIFSIVIAGGVLFLVNLRKLKTEPGEITIMKGSRFVTVIVNAGMGAYCIVFILMMIAQALL